MSKKSANKVKKIKRNINSNNELQRLIMIFAIVAAIVIVFYGITFLVKGKKSNSSTTTNIQYSEIIVGTLLSQSETSYYVLATKSDDINMQLYNSMLTTYKNNNKNINFYTINLDSVFNKQFLTSGESHILTDDVSNILFKDATLIKIDDNKISSYYEGKDNILDYLTSISK